MACRILTAGSQAAFHALFIHGESAGTAVIKVGGGKSVILLLVHVLYLFFQLKSHASLYQTPQHVIDEESHPGILERVNSGTTSPSSPTGLTDSTHISGSVYWVSRGVRAKLGGGEICETGEEAGKSSEEPLDRVRRGKWDKDKITSSLR
ncbi:hypothetical protein HOY82DRAFT_614928 [Tuber indicum]|nr:hypothetical protein HOY82DRAFT_614928 [Tuber indicum]